MTAQRIVGSELETPRDAVRWMLAMQAQDLAGAKWSIGVRVPGCTAREVDAALLAGSIVRSWPMRGTLHLCAAEDLPWLLELLASRTVASMGRRYAELGLDEKTLGRARDVAIRTLSGNKSLTRAQLFAAFERAKLSMEGQRGVHVLGHLSQTGVLCLGPTQGKEQCVVLLEEWIPKPRVLDRDEALCELARRYFIGHGPATLADFVGWTKLTMGDAKAALAMARPSLDECTLDGTSLFMARGLLDLTPSKSALVILPGFDEFILGYKDRSAVVAAEHFSAIVPGNNGIFMPTIVADGKVVGMWRRTHKPKETILEVSAFRRGSFSGAAFEEAATSYGAFLEGPIRVVSSR